MKAKTLTLSVLFSLLLASISHGQEALAGSWKLDQTRSSAVDPWSWIELEIDVAKSKVEISEKVTTGRRFHVSNWKLDTKKNHTVDEQDWWSGNRHIGAFYGDGGRVETTSKWLEDEGCLIVQSRFRLETSQGGSDVREHVEYRVSRDGERLTRITLRSTRDQPVVHVFTKQ